MQEIPDLYKMGLRLQKSPNARNVLARLELVRNFGKLAISVGLGLLQPRSCNSHPCGLGVRPKHSLHCPRMQAA